MQGREKIPDERRKEMRVHVQVHVRLITQGHRGGAVFSEDTVTENVSAGGVCVFSDLPVEAGRYLQLIRMNHTKSFVVAVRARSLGPDQRVRLHLQFVNQRWPLGAARERSSR